jgi:hypothetical protein
MTGTDVPGIEEINRIENTLQTHLSGRVRDLRLEVRGDGLVLRGRARTYYARQLAQQEVLAATLRPVLANEIEVA